MNLITNSMNICRPDMQIKIDKFMHDLMSLWVEAVGTPVKKTTETIHANVSSKYEYKRGPENLIVALGVWGPIWASHF